LVKAAKTPISFEFSKATRVAMMMMMMMTTTIFETEESGGRGSGWVWNTSAPTVGIEEMMDLWR
jgi:hypothetical protein